MIYYTIELLVNLPYNLPHATYCITANERSEFPLFSQLLRLIELYKF